MIRLLLVFLLSYVLFKLIFRNQEEALAEKANEERIEKVKVYQHNEEVVEPSVAGDNDYQRQLNLLGARTFDFSDPNYGVSMYSFDGQLDTGSYVDGKVNPMLKIYNPDTGLYEPKLPLSDSKYTSYSVL